MNKYCSNCGKELPEGIDSCPFCNNVINNNINVGASNTNKGAVATTKKNGMAIAGFVMSLVSMFCCAGLLSPLSLIFSIIGLSKSKNYKDDSKLFSIIGIVISTIMIIILILMVVIILISASSATEIKNNIINNGGEYL